MKTSDYTIFRKINGNRKTNATHVQQLVKAIERKNLLQYYPVLCNEHMEVIDGQHRLAAAAALGYEAHYEKIPGLRIEDVMDINTNSRSWTTQDFINSWVTLDKPDYVILRDFMKRHGFGASIAGGLLRGLYGLHGGSTVREIKAGEFKVSSEEIAEQIASMVTALKRYADFNLATDRELIAALTRLSHNEGFDFDRLVSKLKLHGLKLEKRPSDKYYILHIEELYNFHAQVTTDLYKSTYEKTTT